MTAPDPVRERLVSLGAAEHVVAGGLEGLIAIWERFETALAKGYEHDLDGFRNDVDARNLLSLALSAVPPRARVRDRVRKIDTRVKKLTRPFERCVWGSRTARERVWSSNSHWWYFVAPLRSNGELDAELERLR